MENLRVRRAGFAYRRVYNLFLQRYKCLSEKTWPHYPGDAKSGVQILAEVLGYQPDEYKMGKTKIFIRYPKTLFYTEDAFQAKKHDLAALIQAAWKGLRQRRKYRQMKESVVILQKYVRRFIAQCRARRRKKAANVLRNFIKGFITRNGPVNETNRAFVELAKAQWLIRLSKNLPQHLLHRHWPPCPHVCIEASEHLERLYALHLSRNYRRELTPERKDQFEQKVLAEELFRGKKKSYKASVPEWFKKERISDSALVKPNYAAHLNGEKELVRIHY